MEPSENYQWWESSVVKFPSWGTFSSVCTCGTFWDSLENYLLAEFSSQISRNMFGHSAVVQPAGSKFLVGARPLARNVEIKRPGDLPVRSLLQGFCISWTRTAVQQWGYSMGSAEAAGPVNTHDKISNAIKVVHVPWFQRSNARSHLLITQYLYKNFLPV